MTSRLWPLRVHWAITAVNCTYTSGRTLGSVSPSSTFVGHKSKNQLNVDFFPLFRAYGLSYQLVSCFGQDSCLSWHFTISHIRRESVFMPPLVISVSTSLSLGPQMHCTGTFVLPVTTPVGATIAHPACVCCSNVLVSLNLVLAIGSNLGPCLSRTFLQPQSPMNFVSLFYCF